MRIKQICIIALATVVPMLGMSGAANGAGCLAASCSVNNTSDPVNSDYSNCKTYSDSCYGGNRVRSCLTCIGTLTLTDATISVSGCSNTISYQTCKFSGGGTIIGGDDDCEGTCSTSTTYTSAGGSNCKTSSVVGCYGTQKVTTCKTRSSGYTLTSKTLFTLAGCTVSYKTCVQDTSTCDGTCTNCISSVLWMVDTDRTGVQIKTTATCNTSTCVCNRTYEYRCSAGYYGTASAFINNCTACPDSGTSAAGSNSAITDC